MLYRTKVSVLFACAASHSYLVYAQPVSAQQLPQNLQVVLESTIPVQHARDGRLPLFVLPISNALTGLSDEQAQEALVQLDRRGIGYTVNWNHNSFEATLAEGLRIARLQQRLGQPIAVNANPCLYSFFDGSEETLHVDEMGKPFADESLGGKLGCPFALDHRVPVIRGRLERFLAAYREAGVAINFIFADWEIDGPIEWNDSWAAHKRCQRCQAEIPRIDDFRVFQQRLREIRSEIQRVAFGDLVTEYFPECLVGNYGTYPHNGTRYWYDYFEKEPSEGVPVVEDQRAKYREWAHEFAGAGYTFAMPVVYTWYPIFQWYDFADLDYRWFYNMLLVGSNAGQHTSAETPIITFVHWHTTAPPSEADPAVQQFSRDAYQELLWHLLLRGHDGLFLWCVSSELEEEIQLVHQVYADSLAYSGFIQRGDPVTFDVPRTAGSVISGLRLGKRVLVRRTDFADAEDQPIRLTLDDGGEIVIESHQGLQVLSVAESKTRTGWIEKNGKSLFPIGFYEMPQDDDALREMAASGVNLVRTGSKAALDRAAAADMMGWMPLPLPEGPTTGLRQRIEEAVDHPALAVWEGPDEIVWTFTAYSFLKDRAGFTRDDWNAQKQIAVDYSEKEAARIMPAMQGAVELIRELDHRDRPVWINEAVDSDARFARQYMPYIDITGCDYYAVRSSGTDLPSIGRAVERWTAVGQGRPVWMVLQGFSWHTAKASRGVLYPTFRESRFMAYDAIVHGARGIFYWGTEMIDNPDFRRSLFAVTAELAALQPFLIGQRLPGAEVQLIHDLFDQRGLGVRLLLLCSGNEYLLMLVNEDDHHRLGVDVTGLEPLDGRELHLLYGAESHVVAGGRLVTRMQPYQVKLFATKKAPYETNSADGRHFEQ